MNNSESSCCSIESIVTIDERGQMVLPKDVREKAGFAAGDRIAVVNCYRGDEVCCVALMPASELSNAVQSMIGPVIGGEKNE
jgi:antitoxin PrlF